MNSINMFDSMKGLVATAAFGMALSAWCADVTVSSGTWSAAGVRAGDAVTVTGSCENDLVDIVLGSLTVTAAAGTTVDVTGRAYSFGSGGLSCTGAGTVNFRTDVHGDGPVTLANGTVCVFGATCGLGDSAATITLQNAAASLCLGGTILKNGTITTAYRATESRQDSGNNRVYSFPIVPLADTANTVLGKLTGSESAILKFYPRGGSLVLKGGCGDGAVTAWYACPDGGDWAYSGEGTVTIAETPWTLTTFGGVDYTFGCGRTTVAVAGMKVSGGIYLGAASAADKAPRLETTVDWAFDARNDATDSAPICARGKDGSYPNVGSIDIHATRQRFGGFYANAGTASIGQGVLSGQTDGANRPVFYCRQWKASNGNPDVVTVVKMPIQGNVTFVKEGAQPLAYGGVATTDGDLKVSEGRLSLTADARFAHVGNVVVGKAADDDGTIVSDAAVTPTLALAAAGNLGAMAVVRVNGAGVIEVADGVRATCGRLYVAGEEMPAGEYGATTCPVFVPADRRADVMAHFAGAGRLVALNGAAVATGKKTAWTGAASVAKWSEAANWSNGVPALNDDVTINVAASAGGFATIVNDLDGLVLRSLTLTGGGSVELTGRDITLLGGGLTVGTDDADETSVTNVIRLGLTLAEGQTWAIRGTRRELHHEGTIDTTTGASALTRSGTGVWRLFADMLGDGDVTLAKDSGPTYAAAPNCAFGGAKSTLTIEGQSNYDTSKRGGALLHLCGTVVSNGVVRFDGYYARLSSGQRQCWIVSDAAARENVILGELQFSDAANLSLCVANPKGQTAVFAGGCAGVKALLPLSAFAPTQYDNQNVGTLVLTNGAWKISDNIGMESLTVGAGTLVWGAPGSTVGGKIFWQNADITFTEDGTLGADDGATAGLGVLDSRRSSNTQFYQGGSVHLGATHQRFGGFARDVRSGASFDGTAGSVLVCRQSAADVAVYAPMSGELSFVKEGDRRLTLTAPSDTTGTLGVEEGELVLSADAVWSNVTNLYVAGSATLAVSNRGSFAAKPVVSVAEGAVLDLAFTGRAKVASLTVGGKTYRSGHFGAVGSGAPVESAALRGTGTLLVGKNGLAVIIR